MSDMRFIMIGIVFVFSGFIVLGVFGENHQAATLESNQFGTCYEYSENKPPTEINCSFKIFDQVLFFGIIMSLVGIGIISLIKGLKGDWDNKVNSEDMVGPSRNQDDETEDKEP